MARTRKGQQELPFRQWEGKRRGAGGKPKGAKAMMPHDREALSRAMKGLGVRLARGLNKLWGRWGRVVKDRYHDRALKTPREVRNALVYVLHNVKKHVRRRLTVRGRTVPALEPEVEGAFGCGSAAL